MRATNDRLLSIKEVLLHIRRDAKGGDDVIESLWMISRNEPDPEKRRALRREAKPDLNVRGAA